jgi:hypothetical protein
MGSTPSIHLLENDAPDEADAHGDQMDVEDAALLAREFVYLLTNTTASTNGYVLAIAPQTLVVKDMRDIRAIIQQGLEAEDVSHAQSSLRMLERLRGM